MVKISKIDRLLYDLGITPDLKGFRYIKEAVDMIVNNKGKVIGTCTVIYPHIAAIYATTPNAVEHAIRHAISRAIDLDHGEMQTLIGISPYKAAASNKQFVYALCWALEEDK